MSQPVPTIAADAANPAGGERYRTLSGWSVASVVCGLLSIVVVVDWMLGVVPLLGIACGWFALRLIRYAPDEYQGAGLAWTGIGLSLAAAAAGYGYLWYDAAKEIPHGYILASYEELAADPKKPHEPIPPRAFELDGKKVFVRGYMYPGRQQVNLRRFVISRDNGSCQFCLPNPTQTDRIAVELTGDLRTDYTPHLMRLGGILRVEPERLRDGMDAVVYRLEADYLR